MTERSKPQPAPPDPLLLEFLDEALAIEERPQSTGARYTLYALLTLIIVAVAWAAWAEVDRIVVARGKIVSTATAIVVQSHETAIIREILVRPGNIVEKGAVLARMDATFAKAEQAELDSRVNALSAQIRRLKAELVGDDSLTVAEPVAAADLQTALFKERRQAFNAKMALYEETLARLRTAIEGNAKSQEAIQTQLKTAAQLEHIHFQLLNRGGSRQSWLERQAQRQAIERELVTANNRKPELDKEIAATKAERALFRQDWRQKAAEELTAAERDLMELRERLRKAQRRMELSELTASARAVVLEVAERSVGSVIKEAEPLVTLVPLDVPLEAEVEIETRDVGFVRVDDRAQVKLDAFPYQKHGLISAHVRTLSEDAFNRPQSGMMREHGSEAFYKGRLQMDALVLQAVPSDTRLIPGMSLTVEIKVGRRSILSYFLYPILRILDESLRES